MEPTDELVLELGNHILKAVGAEEEITEIDAFRTDELYLQLFKALFPQLPLDELQPGESAEEVAENLSTLISLLGEYILETDLSYISATSIMEGDLTHLSEFLQILLQVIGLLVEAERDGEGDKEDQDLQIDPQQESPDQQFEDPMGLDRDEPVLGGSGHINQPQDDEMNLDGDFEEDHKIDSPEQDRDPIIQDESPEEIKAESPEIDASPVDQQMDSESPKPKIDVFNDPLIPDDMDVGKSSDKKRRAGSFSDKDDEEDEFNLDDLDDEERVMLVQELYQKYQEDPDNFPDEQRVFLEEQLKDLMDKGIIDAEEEESEQDERMKVHGEMNFPKDPLPYKDDNEDIEAMEKAEEELDVQEVEPQKDELDFYQQEEEKESPKDDQSEEPEVIQAEEDQEAEIIGHIEPEQHEMEGEGEIDQEEEQEDVPAIPVDNTEHSEIDDQTKLAYLQKIHEDQIKIAQRVNRRKKTTKKVKKKRPQTAKYPPRDSRYPRPWTANTAKPKKKKKKVKRGVPQDVYLEQLRQQQILQALAMEQQRIGNSQMEEQKFSDGNIEITPEQAVLLYQQLAERQQAGEELTQEELEQLQFLHTLLEQNAANEERAALEAQQMALGKKKTKRKKSKKRGKRKPKNAQVYIPPEQLMLMQQQLQEQQMPANPNIELPEGVDEIQEVPEEDTPIQELKSEQIEDHNIEAEGEESAEVHDTEIPTQINAQVPAQFRENEEEEEESNIDFSNIDPDVLRQLSPDQIHELQQQLAAQQEAGPNEDLNPDDEPVDLEALEQMLRMTQQRHQMQKEFETIKPLSKSVSKVMKKFKSMRKYELDVYDKKFQSELKKAQTASNRGQYFQEILKQSLENALISKGLKGKIKAKIQAKDQ